MFTIPANTANRSSPAWSSPSSRASTSLKKISAYVSKTTSCSPIPAFNCSANDSPAIPTRSKKSWLKLLLRERENRQSSIDHIQSAHLYCKFALNTFFRSARLVAFHTRRLTDGFQGLYLQA